MNVVSVLRHRIPLGRLFLFSAYHGRKVIPVACPAFLGPAGPGPRLGMGPARHRGSPPPLTSGRPLPGAILIELLTEDPSG